MSPSGGYASLLFDQAVYFASIKLCQALSRQGAIIKIPVVRCPYLLCSSAHYYSSFFSLIFTNNWIILQVIIGSILAVAVYGQRCDKGSKVCVKLEADDPVFQGQRCKVPSDCKGLY